MIELNSRLLVRTKSFLYLESHRYAGEAPAVGAEGFVLDHMNRAATDSYLKTVGDRLLQPWQQPALFDLLRQS